jgi:cellulose biosynthesis protein BcsQ
MARICGILLTMVDYRHEATREIVDIIRVHNRAASFVPRFPQDPRVSEAPSHGIPLDAVCAVARGRARTRRLTTELLSASERRNN